MALDEIAASMRRRMPWPVGRLVLEENGITRGRGWDNTLIKLADISNVDAETESTLVESLRQHLLCGEKYTSFYRLDQSSRVDLATHIRETRIEETPASIRYPLLLNDAELESEKPGTRLIAIEQVEGGLNAVFSSVRTGLIRRVIDEEDLEIELPPELAQYQELIGVKHVKSQGIDVVYIPENQKFIDLRVDCPLGSTSDQIDFARERLRQMINKISGSDALTTPVNLFPLINYMYHSPTEGKVVELAFGTTTRSLKHEKMRRGASDLRTEDYHLGGKAALLTAIEPHRISIEYSRSPGSDLVSRPEVTLASSFRAAAGTTPLLTGAVIRKCSNTSDYLFVRRRLRHFLRQNAPDGA